MVIENGDATGQSDPCNCCVGSKCLSKWLGSKHNSNRGCPSCNRSVVATAVLASRNRTVAGLMVKCHVAPDSCPVVGALGLGERFWREHEVVCAMLPVHVPCPACDEVVLRGKLQEHINHVCTMDVRLKGYSDTIIGQLRLPAAAAADVFRAAFLTLSNVSKPATADTIGIFIVTFNLFLQLHPANGALQAAGRQIREALGIVPGAAAPKSALDACTIMIDQLNSPNYMVAKVTCIVVSHLSQSKAMTIRLARARACESLLGVIAGTRGIHLHSAGVDPDGLIADAVLALIGVCSPICANSDKQKKCVVLFNAGFTVLVKAQIDVCAGAPFAKALQQVFCWAIETLLSVHDEKLATQFVEKAIDAGTVTLLVTAMERFPANAIMQKHACGALALILAHQSARQRAGAAAQPALRGAIAGHPENEEIQRLAGKALAQFN